MEKIMQPLQLPSCIEAFWNRRCADPFDLATPAAMTGAWTGCAVAFLVGFRFWPAFAAIAAGVLLAGVIVTATVVGVQWLVF